MGLLYLYIPEDSLFLSHGREKQGRMLKRRSDLDERTMPHCVPFR